MKKYLVKLTNRQKRYLVILSIVLIVIYSIFLVISVIYNNKKYEGERASGFFNDSNALTKIDPSAFKEVATIGDESGSLKILFTGDIQVGDYMATLVASHYEPFEYVKDIFAQYDLVVVSSEGVIAEAGIGSPAEKPYAYIATPKFAQLYKEAGIDVVTLATNHGMDYGADALQNEIKILDEWGIIHFGAGNNIEEASYPRMIIANGVKIGFVGINDIENYITDAGANSPGLAYHPSWRTEWAIKKAREFCDIVIVMPHWGYEHDLTRAPYQEQWAKQFIDWGADMVVGNHVHVRQGHQVYKDKNIYYALGNFAFTGMAWDPESIIGSMVHVKIENKQIVDSKISTVNLMPWEGFPIPAGDQPTSF